MLPWFLAQSVSILIPTALAGVLVSCAILGLLILVWAEQDYNSFELDNWWHFLGFCPVMGLIGALLIGFVYAAVGGWNWELGWLIPDDFPTILSWVLAIGMQFFSVWWWAERTDKKAAKPVRNSPGVELKSREAVRENLP